MMRLSSSLPQPKSASAVAKLPCASVMDDSASRYLQAAQHTQRRPDPHATVAVQPHTCSCRCPVKTPVAIDLKDLIIQRGALWPTMLLSPLLCCAAPIRVSRCTSSEAELCSCMCWCLPCLLGPAKVPYTVYCAGAPCCNQCQLLGSNKEVSIYPAQQRPGQQISFALHALLL
jgi:hypothetical protein